VIGAGFALALFAITLALFAGMLALLEWGRRLGAARQLQDSEGARAGHAAVEGAIYGLLGLLLAFTFSGAASRFDERRRMIVDEGNALGTAYLRMDLLPVEAAGPLKDKFRRYLDARLDAYKKMPDLTAARADLARANGLQAEIWAEAVAASRVAPAPAAHLLLPALNETFDIATTRTVAGQMHPPLVVFLMLAAMALLSAALVGYGMAGSRKRSPFHMLAYAAVLSAAFYVILDLEYPRLGLIRVDAADAVLVEVRQGMK
jgi:hypothetical protein